MRRRAGARGLTLLEVMVSVGILALVGSLIYGAFDGMTKARTGIARMNDRYHQGRQALARMSRELESAFVSMHMPLLMMQAVRQTAFIAKHARPTDRVDFTAFAHRRLGRDVHESDQCELGYFGASDPEHQGKLDLVRREAKNIDMEPTHGGIVQVLVDDIETLDLMSLDPATSQWVDSWDSTQLVGQLGRLPSQVKITISLRGGVNGWPIRMMTRAPIAIQSPLNFALK
jgi:general secretion pathway protein J